MLDLEYIPGFEYGYSRSLSLPTDYHYHDNYEIYLLMSGENMFFIKDTVYHISNNDMVFIPKGLLHKSNYSSQNYERAVVNFTDQYIDGDIILKMKTIFDDHVYTPKNPDFIRKRFMNIKKEIDKNDDFSPYLIKCYLIELISYCTRHKSEYSSDIVANPIIERLVKYINQNYQNKILLPEIAEMLKMSEGHLSRLFVKNTGFNFSEYLMIIRMKNAKSLLTNSNKSVREIASECGFNDSGYFSTAFKHATGLSPLEYRRSEKDL